MLFINSWQILLGLSMLFSSSVILFQKSLMKHEAADEVTFSIVFQILVGLIIGFFALLHGFRFPNFLSHIPNLFIMISFYGFGNIFMYKALKSIEASEFTILLMTRSIWAILASVVFLHEHFGFVQIIGTLFILLSVNIVNLKRNAFTFNKGFFFTLLAGLFFGIAVVNDAFFLQRSDELSYVSLAFLFPAFGILFVYPKTLTKTHILLIPEVLWKILTLSVLYALASIAFFGAIQVGRNTGQVTVIDQSATILTVILAIIFLHETKDLLKKLLATLVAFVGVILVG